MPRANRSWMRWSLTLSCLLWLSGGSLGCGGGGSPSGAAGPQGGGPVPMGRATWQQMLAADATAPTQGGAPTEGGPHEQTPLEGAPGSNLLRVPQPGGNELFITNGFASLVDNNTVIPPDTMGAVGPNHLVTMLNSQVLIQDKIGNVVSPAVTLNTFFASTGAAAFDPRVLFSRLHGRWLAAANRDARSATAGVVFAISDTDDPTGAWTFYSFDIDPADVVWADFVSVGFNSTWIVLTTDAIDIGSGAFTGEQMWVIDASTALLGGLLTVTTFLPGFDAVAPDFNGKTLGRRMKPCVTHDPLEPTLYILDNTWILTDGLFIPTPTQHVRISMLTGTGPAPAWSLWAGDVFWGAGMFAVPTDFFDSGSAVMPGAPQLGSATPLDTGRALLSSEPQVRDGDIWLTHSGGLPAAGPVDRTAIFWYEIDPALTFDPTLPATPVLQSSVIDGSPGVFHFYPSLAVNRQDDMCVGFSRSSAGIFVEGVVDGRDGTDAPGTTDGIAVIKAGEAAYVKLDSNSRNRWGDYSATCVDPTDDLTIWSIQEYAESPGSLWGTWWARHSPFPPVTAVCPSDPASIECTGPAGTNASLAYSVSDPSGAPLEVSITVNGTVQFTQSIPGAVPGPSGAAFNFNFAYPLGVNAVVMTVQNSSGGSAQCTNTVTVQDTTDPIITCPANVTAECAGPTGTVVNYPAPTVSDICDPAPVLVCVPPSGTAFPMGTTTVTCTATDMSGNEAQCSFDVTIEDTTPPVLTASVRRNLLWLPVNGMLDVQLTSSATDICDASVSRFVTVYSDEDQGPAPYTPDATLAAGVLRLRAQRDQVLNNGRWYLVVVDAVDDSGNRARKTFHVVMPYNLSSTHITAIRTLALAQFPAIPDPITALQPAPGPVAPPGSFTILTTTALP